MRLVLAVALGATVLGCAPGAERPAPRAAVQTEPDSARTAAQRRAQVDSLLADYAGFEPPPGVPEAEARAWADSVLAEMSLEQRVAQMMIVELGIVRDPHGIARLGVGGFHVNRRTAPAEVVAATNALNQSASVPLFFTADFEWGVGTPPVNFVELPAAMAYGAADSEALAEAGGAVTAFEARAQGINVLFAPVADVNNNPANPIINTRSFGSDPQRVGELAGAYVRGAQAHGVLATLKHFPGHGNTATDTHVAFDSVPGDWPSLWATELVPYRAALAERPGLVMTTHLWARALDAQATPATFSRRALTDVLRDSLGYDGIITTDALNMGAIESRYGYPDRAVRPVQAGADVLLNIGSPRRAIRAIVAAVERGDIDRAQVDASVRRLLAAKARLGLHTAAPTDPDRMGRMLSQVRGARFADALAAAAVTVVRPGPLPIRPSQRVALVQLGNFDARRPMARLERDLAPASRVRVASGGSGRRRAVRAATEADVVVVAMHLRVRQGRPPEVTRSQRRSVDAIQATGTPVVLVVLGNPYAAALVPDAAGLVLAYDETARTASAVAAVLAGRARATGRVPVQGPGL